MKREIKSYIQLILIPIFFCICLFNQLFNINFLGEITVFLSIIYLIYYVIKIKKVPVYIYKITFFIFLIIIIGIFGNSISKINRSFFMISMDIFSFFKIYVCFFAGDLYFKNIENRLKIKILKILNNISKCIVSIAFIFYIVNFFYDMNLSFDIRYGIPAYRFFYNSSGWLNQYWIGIVMLISIGKLVEKKRKKRYTLMVILIWLSTLRSRAFVMVFFYILLEIYFALVAKNQLFDKFKRNFFNLKKFFVFTCFSILLGYNQIIKYFFNSKFIKGRAVLLRNSIFISKEYFPLGAGFGTFGTETAKRYYSPLYYYYNMNLHPALNEKRGTELTDCYWPAILAETGIMGVFFIGIIICTLFKYWIKKSNNLTVLKVIILYIIYLIISSSATGIFFSDLTAIYILIIAFIINIDFN